MIYKNDETREKILAGAELLYDAVRTTMGPKGRNILIKDKFGGFHITHDGVTVAKSVKSDDASLQMGIDLIKEASKKMDSIGDGTTSVTVLTYHLIVAMDKLVKDGVNPMHIKRELEALIDPLLAEVDKRSKIIDHTYEAVLDVARISVEDDELAKEIATLVVGTGYEGAITVETHKAKETTFDLIDGYLFPGGYVTPHFVTDQDNKTGVLKNPVVLLIDGTMSNMNDYAPLLDSLLEQNIRDVLIIAENAETEVVNLLAMNKLRGAFNGTLVYNHNGKERLHDLAAITGAKVVNSQINPVPTLDMLGRAEKVVIAEMETIVTGGAGEIESRLNALHAQLKDDPANEELQDRIQALAGKIGTIRVGGVTEMEAKEKKDRIDDAVGATRAALKGGIVAGGGATLFDLSYLLGGSDDPFKKAVRYALQKPQFILLENSGIDEAHEPLTYPQGIDVMTGKEVNMYEAGIVDPTIVTKEVIRNALSVAATAITVGGAIVEPQLTKEEIAALMGAAQ